MWHMMWRLLHVFMCEIILLARFSSGFSSWSSTPSVGHWTLVPLSPGQHTQEGSDWLLHDGRLSRGEQREAGSPWWGLSAPWPLRLALWHRTSSLCSWSLEDVALIKTIKDNQNLVFVWIRYSWFFYFRKEISKKFRKAVFCLCHQIQLLKRNWEYEFDILLGFSNSELISAQRLFLPVTPFVSTVLIGLSFPGKGLKKLLHVIGVYWMAGLQDTVSICLISCSSRTSPFPPSVM